MPQGAHEQLVLDASVPWLRSCVGLLQCVPIRSVCGRLLHLLRRHGSGSCRHSRPLFEDSHALLPASIAQFLPFHPSIVWYHALPTPSPPNLQQGHRFALILTQPYAHQRDSIRHWTHEREESQHLAYYLPRFLLHRGLWYPLQPYRHKRLLRVLAPPILLKCSQFLDSRHPQGLASTKKPPSAAYVALRRSQTHLYL